MTKFSEAFNKVQEDFQSTAKLQQREAYAQLSNTLEHFDSSLREYIQDKTRNDIHQIIRKLRKGETLVTDELDKIRSWVIGDAEQYVLLDKNFKNWTDDLSRIVGAINQHDSNEMDVPTSLKLRGLLRDGIRLIFNISYYLQEKERVDNFTQATENIDDEERGMLIKILEQKIKSADY